MDEDLILVAAIGIDATMPVPMPPQPRPAPIERLRVFARARKIDPPSSHPLSDIGR